MPQSRVILPFSLVGCRPWCWLHLHSLPDMVPVHMLGRRYVNYLGEITESWIQTYLHYRIHRWKTDCREWIQKRMIQSGLASLGRDTSTDKRPVHLQAGKARRGHVVRHTLAQGLSLFLVSLLSLSLFLSFFFRWHSVQYLLPTAIITWISLCPALYSVQVGLLKIAQRHYSNYTQYSVLKLRHRVGTEAVRMLWNLGL